MTDIVIGYLIVTIDNKAVHDLGILPTIERAHQYVEIIANDATDSLTREDLSSATVIIPNRTLDDHPTSRLP